MLAVPDQQEEGVFSVVDFVRHPVQKRHAEAVLIEGIIEEAVHAEEGRRSQNNRRHEILGIRTGI